jgi:hypothetical protein
LDFRTRVDPVLNDLEFDLEFDRATKRNSKELGGKETCQVKEK